MRKTILLADDSVTIQKVCELTFMEEEIDVITVGTGDEALERFAEVAPDLVIADIHMPGTDGYEVCRKVKAERPDLPVLLLVGTFESFDPNDVAAVGAEAHLKKPFDSPELIRVVGRLLGGDAEEAAETEAAASTASAEPAAGAAESTGEEAELGAAEIPGFAGPFDLATGPDTDSQPQASGAGDAAPEPASDGSSSPPSSFPGLSDADVERVARRVVELLGPDAVRDVVWEVVPDLAEVVIKNRLRELEGQVE